MHVLFTAQSQADVQEIADYYLSLGASPQRFLNVIADAVSHLEIYPDTAVRLRDLTRRDVCLWLINPYWMVLKRSGDALHVLSVTHCSRRLGKTIHQRLKDFND